jgi:hypothetical protein
MESILSRHSRPPIGRWRYIGGSAHLTGKVIHRRRECFRAGGDGGSSGVNGVLGHRERGFSKWRHVDFSRLGIGGVDGQDRIGGCVRRHNDRQVERDRLARLSSLSVAIGEDKRNVYTRDIYLVEQVRLLIRNEPVWDSTGIISCVPIRISRRANRSAKRRSTIREDGCTTLNRTLSERRGLKRHAYKASRIWFHCTVDPSVGTLDVFFFVAWLVTVAKNLRPKTFWRRGTFCARRTKKDIKCLSGGGGGGQRIRIQVHTSHLNK